MQKQRLAQIEFIALMASLMSITALSIDAILPALDIIGETIHTKAFVDNQLLITMIFLGLGMGPLIFGPLSDSLGRKPVIYVGFIVFGIASLICIFSENLPLMIAGRILQGIGLSALRTISIAMIRDEYSGDYMARIMSFVTVVFILVPIIAPTLGKAVLNTYNWQAIFYIQLAFSVFVGLWFWKRQRETLSLSDRISFRGSIFLNGLKEFITYKDTIAYTLISGLITGSFMVYLSTSQQIFEQQYDLKEEFPYLFALLAIALGCAIFTNGMLVVKLGMKKLVTVSLVAYFVISLLYIVLFYQNSNPSIVVLMLFFGLQFFSIGFLFGNLRALAMQPIGHIAGIGAAINGFISTIMAVPISTFIGTYIMHSTLPLFIGFSVCSLLSILILVYLNRLG